MAAIPSFEVSGSPYEIGQDLGRRGAAGFRDRVRQLERYRALQRDWGSSERLRQIEACARAAFPRYVEEIEGLADGAGAPFGDIFLWNCRGDFPGGGDQAGTADPGCTSVMIAGNGGRPNIIAHNEDDDALLDGAGFWVTVRPRDGLSFTSFYSPGLLPGHTFGFNERGLVQTINHVRPFDQKAGVPRGIVCRAVLGSATLDAALDVLRRDDRAGGFHHNLGQVGDRRLLSVEAPSSGCAVREIAEIGVHANHLLHPDFAGLRQEVAPSSARRQARAEEMAAAALRARDPLLVLGDDDGDGLPICRKGVYETDPGFTLATAVFEIGARALAWRVHAHPGEAPFHRGELTVADEESRRAAAATEGAGGR